MSKKVLILSWVNPNLVPPVISIIQVLQSNGHDVHVITTDSSKEIPGLEKIKVSYVEFSSSDPFLTRQQSKINYFLLIKHYSENYSRVIVFDNISFVSARVLFSHDSIFYNLLELFDVSSKQWFKSPLDTLLGFLTVILIRKSVHSFYSLPSIQRINWFSNRYRVNSSKIKLIYNTPFVSPILVKELQKKSYNQSTPTIIHTGGVNNTRSVLELVMGFEAMKLPAKLVITNMSQTPYCLDLQKHVLNSHRRNDISLQQFLTYSELVDLRHIASIGVCLMKPNNFGSINIAPNKVGEYLSSGMFVLVTKNPYYEPFKGSGLIVEAETLEPNDISSRLDELVGKVQKSGDAALHLDVLSWYSMNQQAKPILEFLKYA